MIHTKRQAEFQTNLVFFKNNLFFWIGSVTLNKEEFMNVEMNEKNAIQI